jgi:hypothetical protein
LAPLFAEESIDLGFRGRKLPPLVFGLFLSDASFQERMVER